MIANLYVQNTVELATLRLDRFIARVPMALGAPFAPKDWLPMARKVAEETLMVIARPEQQPYVPLFVRTITVQDMGAGMDWSMRAASSAHAIDVRAAADLVVTGQLFLMANSEMTGRLVDVISKWVATEKNKALKGDRDDAAITSRILRILRQADIKSPVPGTVGGGVVMQSAADGLIRTLQDFADRSPDIFGPGEINVWMEAVLEAWTELVLSLLPERLRSQLANAW